MKVMGNDITAGIAQLSVSGAQTMQPEGKAALKGAGRHASGDEQGDDAAYSVRLSEQARVRAKQEFDREQQRETEAFENRARRNEIEFKRAQQQEAEAFQREENRNRADFKRNQQQAAAAFYRRNYELGITNYE
ncbi:MAG: hypothetical protein ACOZF0_14810 [Thermodesulfobacteriota bacterium]